MSRNRFSYSDVIKKLVLRVRRAGTALATLLLAFMFGLTSFSARADVTQVDHSGFTQLVEQGATIIDIRTSPEWQQTGVVHKSHLMTFFDAKGQFDLDAWSQKLSTLVGKDQPVVIICAGGVRSAAVSKVLDQRLGYGTVINVSRGIDDWMKHGGRTREWKP